MIFQACKGSIEYKVSGIELRKRGKTKTILLSFQLLSQKFTQL